MPYTPTLPGQVSILNSYPNHPPYFTDLASLETYLGAVPEPIPPPALPLRPRSDKPSTAGKVVICHDMMGGYPDDAHNPMYTMQWWAIAESFIYFSHHRVSPPPREWINAGHRQGCKVLGTLILEGTSDRYRVISGVDTNAPTAGCISTKYADALIDLCELRGFDGYLMNFEVAYENAANAQLLGTWVAYLRSESRRRLGADRSVIMWYDSVTVDGQLWWQNTLSQKNSAFFLGSDSHFTNYNYKDTTIATAQQYLKDLVGDERPASDVAWGIDMWGRGTWQGGGYRACLALDDIKPGVPPTARGFSAAIFAPAYLWESDKLEPHDRPTWWRRDSLLWVGRSSKQKELQDLAILNTDPEKQFTSTEVYHPLKDYFSFRPQTLPFTTNFSLGAGTFFNFEGVPAVGDFKWSDHEFVAPLPDLAMPCALATSRTRTVPIVVECDWIDEKEKVWFGGHSIQLSCPSYKPNDGILFVPLFTVDLERGPERGCVTMFEVTWLANPTLVNTPAPNSPITGLEVEQGGRRVSPGYLETTPAAHNARWGKTTAFFEGLSGVWHFGTDIRFIAIGSTPSPVVIGAVSIRTVAGAFDSQKKFIVKDVRIGLGNLNFKFPEAKPEFSGTLTWQPEWVLDAPLAASSTANPAWPTISPTTLNLDNVVYLVWIHLSSSGTGVMNNGSAIGFATTSIPTMSFSWMESNIQNLIMGAEKQGGSIELSCRAVDRAGYGSGGKGIGIIFSNQVVRRMAS